VRGSNTDGSELSTDAVWKTKIPFVKLDPHHQTSVNQKVIQIPDPAFQVESLLAARKADYIHEDPDEEDLAIFQLDPSKSSQSVQHGECDYDDDDDFYVPVASSSLKNNSRVQRPKDDWKHNAEWVVSILKNLMPPPIQSSPSASVAIQRELKSMLKEQELAPNLRDLGWYMPPDLIGDNLYQWFVEMHSLDPELPIAKDMKDKYNMHFILSTSELTIMFLLGLISEN
jgi:ubiquitin-conjugating enzyme E2 Q